MLPSGHCQLALLSLPLPPGPKYLSDEEVTQVGDLNWRQSHATHDLYHAIERGEYPEWELLVQVGGRLTGFLNRCCRLGLGCCDV